MKIIIMIIVILLGTVKAETVFQKKIKIKDDMNGYVEVYIDVDKEWNIEGTLVFNYNLDCHVASSGRQVCENEASYEDDLLNLKDIIFTDIKKIRDKRKPLSVNRLKKYLTVYDDYDFKDTSYEALFSYLFLINNKILKKSNKTSLKNFNGVLSIKYLDLEKPRDIEKYNNMAYYLQKAGSNKEAVYLLEKILKKYPNRTVAYYNLGDAYWALGQKKKAKEAYTTYTEQMCNAGKQKRIPKVVRKRVSSK